MGTSRSAVRAIAAGVGGDGKPVGADRKLVGRLMCVVAFFPLDVGRGLSADRRHGIVDFIFGAPACTLCTCVPGMRIRAVASSQYNPPTHVHMERGLKEQWMRAAGGAGPPRALRPCSGGGSHEEDSSSL